MRFDVHVNLLPPHLRREGDWSYLQNENDTFKRAMRHPRVPEIHACAKPSALLSSMDSAGIDCSVCFSYQQTDAESCRIASEYIAGVVEEHYPRLLGLAVCQPNDPSTIDWLEPLMSKRGMAGVKMKPKWGNYSLSDSRLLGPIIETVQGRGGFILTHISQSFHQSQGDSVCNLVDFLKSFPDVTVVAAHLAGFIGVYESYEPIGKHLKNLFVDISLPSNLHWLPHLMRESKAIRYLYATDYPYLAFDQLDRALDQYGLTPKEFETLNSENPMALLGSHISMDPIRA